MIVKVFVVLVLLLKRSNYRLLIISSKLGRIHDRRTSRHNRLVLVFVVFILKDKQIGRNCARSLIFEGDSCRAVLIYCNTIISNQFFKVLGAFIRFFNFFFNRLLLIGAYVFKIFHRCKLRILKADMISNLWRIVLLAYGIVPVTCKTINTSRKT